MKSARWIIALLLFTAFWCVGAFVLLPRMEDKLAQAAREALAAQQTLVKRIDRVQTAFQGQVAHLTGQVRGVQDKLTIEAAVRDHVRAPTLIAGSLGLRLNPVAAVRNDIEIVPYPAGWLLLAIHGTKARLLGEAATDFEARDLVRSIVESWSAKGGSVTGGLEPNLDDHDEASDVSATLGGLPPPPSGRVELHLARIGGRWHQLKLTENDEALHQQAAGQGVSDADWEKQIQPLLVTMRRDHAEAATREKQSLAAGKLPLGHLFIAVRDQRVLLRGEVGSAAIKRALLDEALDVFPARRIHDDIRVNAARRPVADFGALTTALLPAADADEEKAFHLGISGQAWMPLDWRGSREEASWKVPLPEGLDPALLREDNARLIDFLQGSDAGMQPIARTQPAFVVLALVGNKALLSGQIAEPALHAQLVAAVRAAYAPGVVIDEEFFVVRGHCQASADVLHTSKSLPPRGPKPLLAFAIPGGTWKVLEASSDLVQPGALAKSGLLPEDIPPNLVEEAASDALEQLRVLLRTKP